MPFHRKHFTAAQGAQPESAPFEFSPSIGSVLDNVMQSYVAGFIYSALVDSFCSEQNARMTAMQSSTDSAQKMLAELSIQYNRARQAAITQEITEVISGAKAQRRK